MTANDTGTVVVTGGTSGVGRATARAFAAHGSAVAVVARGQEALDATVAELRQVGVPALGLSVDVTDHHAVEDAADNIEEALGPIVVWVNSAMVTTYGEFLDVEPRDFDRVVDVVFGGTANGTRAALRRMRTRDRGRIVQVGSALAHRGIPLQAGYSAAKHATQGLCDALRSELLHQGSAITVSEVNLPAVNTPQFDMGKNLLDGPPQPVPPIFQPELAAEAIRYAAETGEREVNVTFAAARTVFTDRLVPGALDHLLGEDGYASQVDPSGRVRPQGDNLWEPMPGDHGCHGSFDDRALDVSRQELLRHTPVGATARVVTRLGRRVGARVLRPLQ